MISAQPHLKDPVRETITDSLLMFPSRVHPCSASQQERKPVLGFPRGSQKWRPLKKGLICKQGYQAWRLCSPRQQGSCWGCLLWKPLPAGRCTLCWTLSVGNGGDFCLPWWAVVPFSSTSHLLQSNVSTAVKATFERHRLKRSTHCLRQILCSSP